MDGAGNIRAREKGFTLIELVVVIAVLAILTTAIAPSVIKTVKTGRAERDVSTSMYYIANAAINFYNDSKALIGDERWPNNIAEMKSYGYIPNTWSETNPWGNLYTITYNDHYLTVSTLVPSNIANGIKARLKLSEVIISGSNATVTTNVPKPWVYGYPDCGWSDGTDYNGADLTLTNGQQIWGRHKKINVFTVPAGVTATVTPFDGTNGGNLQICAKKIIIQGILTATNAGYKGGCGGGGSSCPDAAEPGSAGQGPFGGTGAPEGNSCNQCTGSNGGTGVNGGYAMAAGNGDTTTDETLLMGSGGGGGGGGGSSYGPNCGTYGSSSGGGGGAGGRGGGYIMLYSTVSTNISGFVWAWGQSSRGNGANGVATNPPTNCTNPCSRGGAGGNPDTAGSSAGGTGGPVATNVQRGGNGGNGGSGAGGGILLKSPSITITGTISNLGAGGNATIGGTIKIFYKGTAPGGTKLGGRVYETTY